MQIIDDAISQDFMPSDDKDKIQRDPNKLFKTLFSTGILELECQEMAQQNNTQFDSQYNQELKEQEKRNQMREGSCYKHEKLEDFIFYGEINRARIYDKDQIKVQKRIVESFVNSY